VAYLRVSEQFIETDRVEFRSATTPDASRPRMTGALEGVHLRSADADGFSLDQYQVRSPHRGFLYFS
jgi:hypothetical protein